MLLSESLYNTVKQTPINNVDEFKDLLDKLYQLCNEYKNTHLHIDMTKKEAVTVIDQIFNIWDCTIRQLKKENYFLVEFLEKYSYKNAFFHNPNVKESYNKLKQ